MQWIGPAAASAASRRRQVSGATSRMWFYVPERSRAASWHCCLYERALYVGRQDRAYPRVCRLPTDGPFDAVIERFLLWALPGPTRTVAAYHTATSDGWLVAVEALTAGRARLKGIRAWLQEWLRHLGGMRGYSSSAEWALLLSLTRIEHLMGVTARVRHHRWLRCEAKGTGWRTRRAQALVQ